MSEYVVAESLYGIVPRLPKGPRKRPGHVKAPVVAPEEHARACARSLSEAITRLVTNSRYPLVNPQAVPVESYLTRVYDRRTKDYRLVEGTPRTWLSGTLKVAAVPKSRGRRFLCVPSMIDSLEVEVLYPA